MSMEDAKIKFSTIFLNIYQIELLMEQTGFIETQFDTLLNHRRFYLGSNWVRAAPLKKAIPMPLQLLSSTACMTMLL